MGKGVALVVIVLFLIAFGLGLEALIAWGVMAAFNAWTEWHPSFWLIFIILLVLSGFSGSVKVKR